MVCQVQYNPSARRCGSAAWRAVSSSISGWPSGQTPFLSFSTGLRRRCSRHRRQRCPALRGRRSAARMTVGDECPVPSPCVGGAPCRHRAELHTCRYLLQRFKQDGPVAQGGASPWRRPCHLGIEPDRHRSLPLERLVVSRTGCNLGFHKSPTAHIVRPPYWHHEVNFQVNLCNGTPPASYTIRARGLRRLSPDTKNTCSPAFLGASQFYNHLQFIFFSMNARQGLQLCPVKSRA